MTKKLNKDLFILLCRANDLPDPIGEFRFHPVRRWRFDWLFPLNIALEVEGGVFIQGRHSRGEGMIADMEKYNVAQCMGYIVLRCTPKQIQTGEFAQMVKTAMAYRVSSDWNYADEERIAIPPHVSSQVEIADDFWHSEDADD